MFVGMRAGASLLQPGTPSHLARPSASVTCLCHLFAVGMWQLGLRIVAEMWRSACTWRLVRWFVTRKATSLSTHTLEQRLEKPVRQRVQDLAWHLMYKPRWQLWALAAETELESWVTVPSSPSHILPAMLPSSGSLNLLRQLRPYISPCAPSKEDR